MSDPIRDDTTPAFTLPEPIHFALDMPPTRTWQPEFVRADVVRSLVEAWLSCDHVRFGAEMEAMRNRLGLHTGNSGNVAPIQGQG